MRAPGNEIPLGVLGSVISQSRPSANLYVDLDKLWLGVP